jgi:hypothetical protein
MTLEDIEKFVVRVNIPSKYEAKARESGLKFDEVDKKWTIPSTCKPQYEYLQVPYNDKDQAKQDGCMWDKERKQWYTFAFMRHLIEKYSDEQIYLDVPFSDKDDVKANGARWDKDKKKWYTYTSNTYLVDKYT